MIKGANIMKFKRIHRRFYMLEYKQAYITQTGTTIIPVQHFGTKKEIKEKLKGEL